MKIRTIAILGAVAAASFSQAGLVFYTNPGNFPGDENILFQQPLTIDTGLLVTGESSSTNYMMEFYNALEGVVPETLSGLSSSGQSRLVAVDGSFSNVSAQLALPNFAFKTLIVNANTLRGAGSGLMTVTVDMYGGAQYVFSGNPIGSGGNWFRLEATAGDWIKRVRYESTVELEDMRQWRVGGIGDPTAIPGPAAILPFASGLIAYRRRRKQA